MNTTCCKMIHDKNEDSSKISATDSPSTTSSSSTATIIATTDTTCRNNNNNPCSNNAIGSNGGGVAAILRANNDNDPPNYYGDSSNSSSNNIDDDKKRDIIITNRVVGQIKITKEEINPCSNNVIGSNGDGIAILRANNDNDPNNYYGDSSSSNNDGVQNRDIFTKRAGQIKIKKEEIKGMQHYNNDNNNTYLASCDKNKNNNNNNLDDNSYADWEVGSWCWLLPTAKNHKDDITNTTDRKRKQKQKSLLDNNTINEDGNDVNYGDPPPAAAGNNASIRNDDGIYKDNDNDNEEEPMKKKMRMKDNEDKNNEHITDTTTPMNDTIKTKNNRRDNKDDNGYESWMTGNWCWLLPADRSIELKRWKSDTNTGQLNSSSSCSSSNSNKDDDDDDEELVIKQGGKSGNDGPREEDISDQDIDDDDKDKDKDNDGYESWTVGNWCWILPPSSDESMTEETAEHRRTGVVPTVNDTTNIRVRSSPRRRCSSSSVHRLLHDDDEDDDDDDDFEDNRNNERINSNTGKITMSYKRWHTEIWHEMYQRLAAYKKQHYDSTSVPQGYKADPKLAIWVTTQRTLYRKNEISEERINYLDSISFVWKTLEIFPWDEMFQRLVTYKKKFKSTLVPQKYPYLGRWVSTQRAYYNKKELSVERINLLESIGFVWNPLDEQWMVMYQKLVTYKKQHRSTKVPWNYTDDPKLGIWVMRQRQVYNSTNSSILTKKRQELLSSIDFTWSAN